MVIHYSASAPASGIELQRFVQGLLSHSHLWLNIIRHNECMLLVVHSQFRIFGYCTPRDSNTIRIPFSAHRIQPKFNIGNTWLINIGISRSPILPAA